MNTKARTIWYAVVLAIGAALAVLGACGVLNDFYCGFGSALSAVALLRLVQMCRYRKDAEYAKHMDVRYGDERELYIAEKARSVAFRITVVGVAVANIVFVVLEKEEMRNLCALLLAGAVAIYLVTYLVIKKKY